MKKPIPYKKIDYRKIWVCVCLAFFTTLPEAGVETVTQDVSGYGSTRNEALMNGLVEAVQQVHGIDLDTRRTLQAGFLEMITDGPKGHEETTINAGYSRQIGSASKGFIQTYKVLSSQRTDNGRSWEVRVQVDVLRHKTSAPERAMLPTLAILPFRVDGQLKPRYQLADQLAGQLTTASTRSDRFRVLDRQYLAEHHFEIEQMKSTNMKAQETTRLRQQLGVDYLLVGDLDSVVVQPQEIDFYGSRMQATEALGVIHYRLIDVASQEVRWADSLKLADIAAVRQIPPQEAELQLLGTMADSIIRAVLEALYPIRVLEAAQAQSIILSQGNKRLSAGQRLAVFAAGRQFVDPDTQQSLASDGPQVALLSVTNVKTGYAVADLIHGNLKDIPVHAIARPVDETVSESERPIRNQPSTPGASDAPVNW